MNGTADEHLDMLERWGVKLDPSLHVPDCPARFAHLMIWFAQLARQRRQAMSGVHPFVWADMDAWARRTKQHPTEPEWDLITQLDTLFRDAAQRHKPADKSGPGRGPPRR